MAHPPWVIGDLIQPRYLDTVQEVLSDWSDNVLLQATGAAVVVPGSPSSPAELVIDGQMRVGVTNHVATGLSASALYNIWATTKTGATAFSVIATPTAPSAAHMRLLGTAQFNGSQVSDVDPAVREVNVSHIYGHAPSETPSPGAVPAARADGTLDPAWLDSLESGLVPVGGVREVWVPSGVAYSAPTGWRLLDGSTLTPAQHSFSGVGTIVLPNMKNKHSLGANTAAGYGSSGSDSGVAPGLGANGGDHTAQTVTHDHAAGGHTHTLGSHGHPVNHYHGFAAHHHSIHQETVHFYTTGGNIVQSAITAADNTGDEVVDTNTAVFASGNTAPGTGGDSGSGVTPNGPPANDLRPWSAGLAYVMRVM